MANQKTRERASEREKTEKQGRPPREVGGLSQGTSTAGTLWLSRTLALLHRVGKRHVWDCISVFSFLPPNTCLPIQEHPPVPTHGPVYKHHTWDHYTRSASSYHELATPRVQLSVAEPGQ